MKHCPSYDVDRYFPEPDDTPRWRQFLRSRICICRLKRDRLFITLFRAVQVKASWGRRSQHFGFVYYPDCNADEEYAIVGLSFWLQQAQTLSHWHQVLRIAARPAPIEDRGIYTDGDGYPTQDEIVFLRRWEW